MNHRRLSAIGVILLVAGLAVIAFGTVFPSHDLLVAVGWLVVAPSLVALSGSVIVVVGLARSSELARTFMVLVSCAVAGVGLALGWGAAGALSQMPDWLAGLNGSFVPGPATGASALLLAGFGASAGLLLGALIALVWWSQARRLPEVR